jgi:hypothetical protein
MPVFNHTREFSMEPLLVTVAAARAIAGVGTTKLYELIGTGILDARKAGTRTLITGESLRRYADTLPKADIRTGRKAFT